MTRRELRLLEGTTLGAFIVVITLIFCATSLHRLFMGNDQIAAVVASVLVDLANSDRESNALSGLTMSPLLVAAAQAKANDMAEKSYFAHNSPEGYDSWHWFKEVGYSYSYAGENLAVDFTDSDEVEQAWMMSESHRENILGQKFTEIGIATARGTFEGHPTTFVVQMFGTPTRKTFAIAPTANQEDTLVIPDRVRTNDSLEGSTNVLGQASEGNAEIISAGASAEQQLQTRAGSLMQLFRGLIASPEKTMRIAYYIVGLLVILALAATTQFEFRAHHKSRFIAAGALLVFMSVLFVFADTVLFPAPILTPGESIESTIIAMR